MKRILLLIVLQLVVGVGAQNRKGNLQMIPGQPYDLYVAFDSNGKYEASTVHSQLINTNSSYKALHDSYNFELSPAFQLTEERLSVLRNNALKTVGHTNTVDKLQYIFKVNTQGLSSNELLALALALENLEAVEYCNFTSLLPTKPPVDIPPTTSNLEPSQTYLNSNPGVNMQYAWNMGLTGQGIRIRDVEYGFNKLHEELSDVNSYLAPDMTVSPDASEAFTEHGTAVFGIMYAHKGTYGISGMAYGAAEMVLYPEWQETGYNRINAVSEAIFNSATGDVIVYEMQTDGLGTGSQDYVMAELDQVIWDLTKAATDSGITIVAAAGNGNVNLDLPLYNSYNARGDSGAIIVGAGTASVTHNRLSFSTYGTRVNLQGWGANVQSIGKLEGVSTLVGNDFNQSYAIFSGTSSATPIVASCAAVLQSYYHSLTGTYLTSQQLRTIMRQTGLPQTNPAGGIIGPLPNMQPAIDAVFQQSLGVTTFDVFDFKVYPNPVEDQVTILTSESISPQAQIEIFNSLGQRLVVAQMPSDKSLDLSGLPHGIYFLKISEGNRSLTQKISKK